MERHFEQELKELKEHLLLMGGRAEAIVRELLLVMPRLVGRVKRLAVPEALGSLDLAPLLTHRFAVTDGPAAVEFANANRSEVIKAVLQPDLAS